AGDFGFSDSRRTDHDYVLGNYFFSQIRRKLLAAHAVAQSNRDGALGVVLPDNMLIELSDNFARSQFVQRELFFFGGSGEINSHKAVSRQATAIIAYAVAQCECR